MSRVLLDLRVTAIRYASRDTHLYEFQNPDGGYLPPFDPGAHIDLHLPNGLVRQYSLVGSAEDLRSYTVGVKRDRSGRGGSMYIHSELSVGQILKLSEPRTNFPLREDVERSLLFAGGIGITPIWCMVQRLMRLDRRWALHYACRSRADMAFYEDLVGLAPVSLHLDDENHGACLDIASIVAATEPDTHLYCCGPAPMLSAFESATQAWPQHQVHVEYFAPKPVSARSGGFTVVLARSGREFFVPEDRTILDMLIDLKVDVSFSCEQGVCGSCETVVLEGVPDHRDSVLTEAEKALNTRMMICCAGSKTERLVLDL